MVLPPIFERIRESARQKKVQVQKAVNNRIRRRRRSRSTSSRTNSGTTVRSRSRENVAIIDNHRRVPVSNSRPSSSIFTNDDRSVITNSSYRTADNTTSSTTTSGDESCRKVDFSRASTATLTAETLKDAAERVVFLQYQGETKRAVLPIDPLKSAVKSLDDVRALFATAFPDHYELTLQYLRSPNVKIYIQDPMKMDFFYELDDLSDVKDRSVLKLREYSTTATSAADTEIQQLLTSGGADHRYQQQQRHKSVEDMNYFSEPEFDGGAEGKYRLQKSLSTSNYNYGGPGVGTTGVTGRYGGTLDRYSNYKMGIGSSSYHHHHQQGAAIPPKPGRYFGAPGGRSSLRNGYSPPRTTDPYASEQEDSFGRAISGYRDYAASPSTDSASVDALYQQRRGRVSRSGSATPVIDEEARVRMINMEKQLASLSALVHSALMSKGVSEHVYKDMEMLRREIFGAGVGSGGPPSSTSGGTSRDDASDTGSLSRFSDLSSEKGSEREGTTSSSAPFSPPPIITSNSSNGGGGQSASGRTIPVQPSTIHLTPEARHNLRSAKRKVSEVQGELKNLRRMAQLNAQCGRDIIRDAFERIKFLLNTNKHLHLFAAQAQQQNLADASSISGDRKWINHEEDRYLMETKRVEKGLSYLEKDVEELRQKVISGDRRLRMSEVEQFTDNLTQIGRTAANLKNNFSSLENRLRNYMTSEMEKVVREEKFLKDEPSRLDNALKRCKKLANTMVTMKKLALVQDPTAYSNGGSSIGSRRPPLPSKSSTLGDAEVKSTAPILLADHQRRPLSPLKERTTATDAHHLLNGGGGGPSIRSPPATSTHLGPHSNISSSSSDPTHPLDNLLEELQSAAKHKNGGGGGVRCGNGIDPLNSLNSSGDSDTIKRSPRIANESSMMIGGGMNSVLRTNLSVNIPNRGGGSPERRSMSPSPLATSFRAAVPFLHGGRLGAPTMGQGQQARSGTPTSVASEPSVVYSSYRRTSDHSVPSSFIGGRVPPPPPRSSSRNAVGGDSSITPPRSADATSTPSILSFRAEFEKKQRFFSGSSNHNHQQQLETTNRAAGRETPIAIVQTNAVDDETKSYVRSASSSESVNSQEAPGSGAKRIIAAAEPIEPRGNLTTDLAANKQNRYVKFQLPDGHG